MTRLTHTISLVLIAAFATAAQGQQGADEESSKGTAPLVGGIILTSVGTAAGLWAMLLGLGGMDCPDNDTTGGCNSSHSDDGRFFFGGAALAALSLGVGIPLIVHGVKQRHQWRAQHNEHATGAAYRLDLLPSRRGGNLALTMTLP